MRLKTVINNNITEQTNTFICLDSSISCQNEKDVTAKISNPLQITGIINRTLKPSQVQKHARLKMSNSSASLVVLYGRESWVTGKHDK